jgi:hypothetical protein
LVGALVAVEGDAKQEDGGELLLVDVGSAQAGRFHSSHTHATSFN